jgi:hypothetical protein
MNFNIGSMMGMMGGAPVVKSGDVIINKLKAAKVMEPGDMGDIMKSAMQGGLLSILKNPAGQSGGKAKQSTQQAQDRVNPDLYPGTAAALTDLSNAIDDLVDAAGDVVGVGPDPAGLLGTIAVAQSVQSLAQVDPVYSLDALLAPANASGQFEQVSATVFAIAYAVEAGFLDDIRGAQQVGALTALLQGVLARSQVVRDAADQHATLLATVAAAAALATSGDPAWKSVLRSALLPDALTEIDAQVAEFLTIDDGEPP